jgi:hypothetical protein
LLLDDDGEMFNTLVALQRILVELVASGDEDQEPSPDLGPDQLNAVHRVLMQLHAAESSPGVDLYDPSGSFQYCTLRVFCPLITDLDEISRSLDVLRVAADSPYLNFVRETIEDMTERFAPSYVENLDRACQTLAVDAGEYGRLCKLAAEHTGKLVLDIDQDGAYRAFVEHVVRVRGSGPLEWFLYLGGLTN